MMFSPLSYDVDKLGGITGVSLSTIERLFVEKKRSNEILTSITDFVTGWRALLGDPRSLFAIGAPGICGREGCASPAITVVGFSDVVFASRQGVPVEDAIVAVCRQHKTEFFGVDQHMKTELVTLKANVVTLEEAMRSLEEEKRSVEEEKRSLEEEERFVEEEQRSLEAQVATLKTDMATSRDRVDALEGSIDSLEEEKRAEEEHWFQ